MCDCFCVIGSGTGFCQGKKKKEGKGEKEPVSSFVILGSRNSFVLYLGFFSFIFFSLFFPFFFLPFSLLFLELSEFNHFNLSMLGP